MPISAGPAHSARSAPLDDAIGGPCTRRLSLRSASAIAQRRESNSQPCQEIDDLSSSTSQLSARSIYGAELQESSRLWSNTPIRRSPCPPNQVKSSELPSPPAPQQRRASNRRSPNKAARAHDMAQSSEPYSFPTPTLPLQQLAPTQITAGGVSLIATPAAAPHTPTALDHPLLSSPTATLSGIELEDLDKDELIKLIRKNLMTQATVPDVDPESLDRLRRPSARLSRVRKTASGAGNASIQHPVARLVAGQKDSTLLALTKSELGQGFASANSLVINALSPDNLMAVAPSIPQTEQAQEQSAAMASKSPKKSAKRDRNQPPRPSNPWILYRSAQIRRLRADPRFVETSQGEISKLISYMWRDEDPQVRVKYEQLAAEAKARHADKYPGYTYRPAIRVRRELAADGGSPPPTASPSRSGVSGPSKAPQYTNTALSSHSTTIGITSPPASPKTHSWEQLTNASSTSDWLQSIPSTPATLDASINDLLASINKQRTILPHGYAVDPIVNCADYGDSNSPSSGADLESPTSSIFTFRDHLVPLSAPAAFSFFDFGLVPSALRQARPIATAPMSPAWLAYKPLACPSTNSCSTASDSSMSGISPSMCEYNGEDQFSLPKHDDLSNKWLYPSQEASLAQEMAQGRTVADLGHHTFTSSHSEDDIMNYVDRIHQNLDDQEQNPAKLVSSSFVNTSVGPIYV
ncbi:BQ5605_C014g07566 [Microbotryum silenes-dioicae]|uniref:BQ5605_C014g07566 protein n=1 Tax=Microbotryum silenes-dioicae TaxID=796604 RepID=A0A2X0NRL9_9BASI|nr:BQ5605_C014g07566 [Microbotryum silenes-dioicae]